MMYAAVRLAQAHDPVALAELDRARRALTPGTGTYLRVAMIEADALIDRGDVARAAAVLEEASVPVSRVNLRNVAFAGVFWLQVRAALVRVYRVLGRDGEAARIESDIAKWLQYADRDFRLLPEPEPSRATGPSGHATEPSP
jgi:hypothetical protein